MSLLQPLAGEGAAHAVGALVVCALLLRLISRFVIRTGARETPRLLAPGAVWLAATVAFEFGFGHHVAGHSWQKPLADHDLTAGRVRVLRR